MKKSILIVSLIFAMLPFPLSAVADGPNMREGQWEITSTMKMPGMPEGMGAQKFVSSQCMTKEDMVPQGDQDQTDQNCKVEDVQMKGDTVSWTMRCTNDQGPVTGKGTITYKGDAFEGDLVTIMSGMTINQHMTGRRTGDCQ